MEKNTFDGIKEEVVKICATERNALKQMAEILLIHKEMLQTDYGILLRSMTSTSTKLKKITTLVNFLYEKAILDPLGLHSRAYLNDNIPLLSSEYDLAFLIADVDKFKQYNNTYGHLQGDIALIHISKKFSGAIIKNLHPCETSLIARYGVKSYAHL